MNCRREAKAPSEGREQPVVMYVTAVPHGIHSYDLAIQNVTPVPKDGWG